MRFPHPGGFGGFGGAGVIFGDVVAGLFFLIVFAVVVGLIFLLVRYLLVATRAAELYIANNSAPVAPVVTPVAPAGGTTTEATVAEPAATTPVVAKPVVTKPAATKPTTRTPKAKP